MSTKRIDTTANRLRAAITNVGKTQTEIARLAKIDRGSMSHYLKGSYEPKQDVICRLAQVLDVSEMWLWGYDCPMERPKEQKNNDIIANVVVRLRTDEDFMSVVESLYNLDSEKVAGVKHMLNALL